MTESQKRRREQARVRHPKVKTGCITCRNRRVKCDETRPSCTRCRKYGTECEGYLPGRRRPPSSSYGSFASQARALVPKSESPTLMVLQPANSLFETDLEFRYFRLFADSIATEICPYFNPESWSRMILQACATEASIRHAAVAIGALGRTYEVAQSGPCPVSGESTGRLDRLLKHGSSSESSSPTTVVSPTRSNEAHEHHRAALEQYDKAIKCMRKDISCGNQTLRTTLIICIVIICFEAIHGNHESAAAQLQSGLNLVQEWKSKQIDSPQHPQGFSSPVPDVVEDYLVQTFGRMEIQSMSVFDPRPVSTHQVLKEEGKTEVEQMPKQFFSVDQARIYLDLVTRRLMHYNASIHSSRSEKSKTATDVPPRKSPFWVNGRVPQAMPWIDGKIPLENKTSTLSSPDILAEQRSLTNEILSWTDAFRPLLIHSQNTGGQEAISALTLSISALTSQISLRAAFFINETAYDVFLPEFKIIVDYATLLLRLQEHQQNTPKPPPPTADYKSPSPVDERQERGLALRFAFDLAVVPPLYTVVIKCRDPQLRRAALRLLERYPRREGVWDSVAVAGLGRWVMSLEEEGTRRFSSASPSPSTVNGRESSLSGDESSRGTARFKSRFSSLSADGHEVYTIPEEMRVRKAAMRFDLLARKASMSCMQMDFESGVFVDKKEIFRW